MTTLIIGLLIPLLGTMLGSAFVFFMKKDMSPRLQKSLLGFASGVMVAASVWSLLIPSMEMATPSQPPRGEAFLSVVPAAVGFLLGMGFLLMIDELTPHLHIGTDKPEGPRSRLSKTAMLALAVTIHNLPEGMAVGVVFAGAESGMSSISLASAIAVSLGIAIQNVPEGAIISMPMRAAGNSKWKSFLIGSLSGARPALHAGLCRWRYVLRRCRGTDSRSQRGRALQSQHHRFCHRLRTDDGARCSTWLKKHE